MSSKLTPQLLHLGVVEEGIATEVVHPQQRIKAAVLVALEVAGNRVRVDEQGIGDIGDAPPVAKRDKGVDPVCLAHVRRAAVCGAQLGEFLLVMTDGRRAWPAG